MIPSERQEYIYRYVHEHQMASITVLAELMAVSHMTVRRDIRVLEEEGKVISISGGIRLSNTLRQELTYSEKALLHHRQKHDIGQLAASLVEDGQVVYLDAGTTTFKIAHFLAERFNLTIVTNDFSITQYLINRPQLKLFHTGGQVDMRNYSCIGNSAAMLLRSLNIDIAFISTSSWDLEHGLSTPTEGKVIVKQALLEVARRRVLVSDSSKFGKYAMFRISPLTSLSDIVCDSQLAEDVQKQLIAQKLILHLTSK